MSKQADEITALKQRAIENLDEIIPVLITAEDAAAIIGVSAMTIYRWKSAFFLPKDLKETEKIINFIEEVAQVKAGWTEICAAWRRFDEISLTIQEVFFHPQLRRILDSDLPIEEKVSKLTKLTFKIAVRG